MNKNKRSRNCIVLPLIAVLSVFLMVMVVFFVDVAYMQLTRTQLQAATDAAAKAGCEAIDASLTVDQIKQVAIDVAAMNEVAGQPLVLEMDDIQIGNSTENGAGGNWSFQSGATPYNAVRVTGIKSDDKPSGSVPLFFSGTLGIHTFTPSQEATATRFRHEIMLCVDRSHSMCFDFEGLDWWYPGEPDKGYDADYYCNHVPIAGSRWVALNDAVSSFLSICESNATVMQQKIGLVTWSSKFTGCAGKTIEAATIDVELGFDFSAVNLEMQTKAASGLPGATNLSAGIDAGISELTSVAADPLAKKTLILFTDGQWNNGDNPATRVAIAQANNITIHVVSLLDNLDPAEMDNLAQSTGGVHYRASTPAELLTAFNALARSMPVVLTK